jgi:hypothetical protein
VVVSVKYAGSFLETYTLARYPPAYPVAQAAVSLTHCSGTEKTMLQASALLKQRAAQREGQTHAALDFVSFLQHSNRTQLCTAHAFSSRQREMLEQCGYLLRRWWPVSAHYYYMPFLRLCRWTRPDSMPG